jgi:hypothetical protein
MKKNGARDRIRDISRDPENLSLHQSVRILMQKIPLHEPKPIFYTEPISQPPTKKRIDLNANDPLCSGFKQGGCQDAVSRTDLQNRVRCTDFHPIDHPARDGTILQEVLTERFSRPENLPFTDRHLASLRFLNSL